MRRLALIGLLLLATPAWADDAPITVGTTTVDNHGLPPTVGETLAKIEDLQKQIDFLKAALGEVRTQRDQVSSALQDALANAVGLKAQSDAAAKRAATETKPEVKP